MFYLRLLCFFSGFLITFQSYSKDCPEAPIPNLSDSMNYPVIGFPSKTEAQALVENYLFKAVCSGQLPENSRFTPYFFEISDLSLKYEIVEYIKGFAKKPASLQIKLENGLPLLFCFNRLVINCAQAKRCECPYDFNWPPQRRKE